MYHKNCYQKWVKMDILISSSLKIWNISTEEGEFPNYKGVNASKRNTNPK